MRELQRITKRANEVVQYPFNFGDWAQLPEVSPGLRPLAFTVSDSPDLIENHSIQGDVVVLNLNGGDDGETYRVTVTATGANGLTRSVVLEVTVWGVREGGGGGEGPSGAVNVIDALDSNSQVDAPSIRAVAAALAAKAALADGITGAERTKLAGIAAGATVNAADAALRDRATHTGTQAISSVVGLQPALDAKLALTAVGLAGGVAGLGGDGKVPSSQLPNLSATTFRGEVSNEAAMLAVVANQGDFVIRNDLSNTWICVGTPSNVITAWRQLAYPSSPVTSVAGKTGAVALVKSDVGLSQVANLAPADLPLSTAAINANATKADVGHVHTTANVSGLDAALAGKAPVSHTHEIANVNGLQTELNGKAASAHTQAISTVLGLQAALDAKQPLLAFLIAGAALGAFHTINFGSGFTGAIVGGVLTLNVGGDNSYVDEGYVDPGYVSA